MSFDFFWLIIRLSKYFAAHKTKLNAANNTVYNVYFVSISNKVALALWAHCNIACVIRNNIPVFLNHLSEFILIFKITKLFFCQFFKNSHLCMQETRWIVLKMFIRRKFTENFHTTPTEESITHGAVHFVTAINFLNRKLTFRALF